MKWYRILSTAKQAFNFQKSLRMMKGKSEILMIAQKTTIYWMKIPVIKVAFNELDFWGGKNLHFPFLK